MAQKESRCHAGAQIASLGGLQIVVQPTAYQE